MDRVTIVLLLLLSFLGFCISAAQVYVLLSFAEIRHVKHVMAVIASGIGAKVVLVIRRWYKGLLTNNRRSSNGRRQGGKTND